MKYFSKLKTYCNLLYFEKLLIQNIYVKHWMIITIFVKVKKTTFLKHTDNIHFPDKNFLKTLL